MHDVAEAFRPEDRPKNAFSFCEKFRSAIPEGATGWVRKGVWILPVSASVLNTRFDASLSLAFPVQLASSGPGIGRVMPKTILLADDSPLVGQALYRLLASEENCDLRVQATDGKSALSLAQECRPDLVILDLSMPKMNGLQTARELKRIMPGVPIILFTLHADAVDESVARDWCVDSVVLKGDFKRLMNDVRKLLSDENRDFPAQLGSNE